LVPSEAREKLLHDTVREEVDEIVASRQIWPSARDEEGRHHRREGATTAGTRIPWRYKRISQKKCATPGKSFLHAKKRKLGVETSGNREKGNV